MSKFKEKLTKQLLASYTMMLISDLLIALLYMLIYNELLEHLFKELGNINILQAYLIFYCVRLIFNRNNIKLSPEEEIFDSFKRNMLKFVHYLAWGVVIKLLFIFCM